MIVTLAVLGATPWPERMIMRKPAMARPSGVTFATPAKIHHRSPLPKAFVSDRDCTLPSSLDCTWSLTKLKCSPHCRNKDCGLVSCNCELIPSLERPPWRQLNVSLDAWYNSQFLNPGHAPRNVRAP